MGHAENKKVWIYLDPADVLLFRDARPFDAGAAYMARGLFPPLPETLQGAVWTYKLETQNTNWQEYRAHSGEHRNLEKAANGAQTRYEIQGPFPAERMNGELKRLYPVPLDVMQDEETGKLIQLTPQPYDFIADTANFPKQVLAPPPIASQGSHRKLKEAKGWLNEAEFAKYINGEAPDHILADEELFLREERTGVKIGAARVSEKSFYYKTRSVRMQENKGLLFSISDWQEPDSGTFFLGGETHTARFTAHANYVETEPKIGENGKLKIVLLTPAFFSGGWQRNNGDWSSWLGKDATLVAAAIGKPIPISGWNVARRQPKPLHYFVPAGSVYYFENAAPPKKPFTQTPEDMQNAGMMGYGAFAVGKW